MVFGWLDEIEPAFADFNRFQEEINKLFNIGMAISDIRSVPRGTFPPVTIQEGKDTIVVHACVPGVDPKGIELVFQENVLTLKGNRDTLKNVEEKNVTLDRFHRRERFSGTFSRSISLPEGLDPEKIDATYRDGVLEITLGKLEEKKPKQITVKVG